jgi:hypothetical protein
MAWGRVLVAASAAAFTIASVSGLTEVPGRGPKPVNSGRPAQGAFLVDFSKGHDDETQLLVDLDIDAEWLGVSYRDENVGFGRQGMSLVARRDPTPVSTHSSAEFQYVGFYGYGRYEAVIRASNAKGVVTAFFVYTGEDMGDPHDEIDVELVWRGLGRLHVNSFHHGKGTAKDIDLGFDTSEGEHLYAFEWLPDSITWFVDGVQVHRIAAPDTEIPSTTGRVMASVWAANRTSVDWVGDAEFDTTVVFIRCISHVPLGRAAAQCSDSFAPPLP